MITNLQKHRLVTDITKAAKKAMLRHLGKEIPLGFVIEYPEGDGASIAGNLKSDDLVKLFEQTLRAISMSRTPEVKQ